MKFIAVDWDGTFTENPDLWRGFIKAANACDDGRQFRCFFVTARRPCEEVQQEADSLGIEAIFTSGLPKIRFCEESGSDIHIWIDDMPELLFKSAER
jgi:hypothetical protein